LGSFIVVRCLQNLVEEECLRDNHAMLQVGVEEIQRDLTAYLQRVEAGETVVIIRAGQPVAEMKPAMPSAKTLRPFGLCSGEFMVPEDFDAPLSEDILNAFEGTRGFSSIHTFSAGSSVGTPGCPQTGATVFVMAGMRSY
jgi:antitoxin (DNA-binding transcriptional repressor) of toxin-antitoxin stability system